MIWVSDVLYEDTGAFPTSFPFPDTCGTGIRSSAEGYDRTELFMGSTDLLYGITTHPVQM